MNALATQAYTWQCGGENAYACSVVEWGDRSLPGMATWKNGALGPGCNGAVPWEVIILAANELNQDIWINIPVTASSPFVRGTRTPASDTETYVYQLAQLLKDGNAYTDHKGVAGKIFIEHSNEVWNFGFKQYSLNKAAAAWEVNSTHGKSNLAGNFLPGFRRDGWANCAYTPEMKNQECWAHRRHARRVWEIGKTFADVFGRDAIGKQIQPVYASWMIPSRWNEYYNHTLQPG